MSQFALIQGSISNPRRLHVALLAAGMVVGKPLTLLQLHKNEEVWRPPRPATAHPGHWAIAGLLDAGHVALNVIVFGDAAIGKSDDNEYLVACDGTLSEEDRERCGELFGVGPEDPIEQVLAKYLRSTRWANGLMTRPMSTTPEALERHERRLDPVPGLQQNFGTSDFTALVVRTDQARVDIIRSSEARRVYASRTGDHLVTSSRVLAETYLDAASVVPLDATKRHYRFVATARVNA